MAIRAECLDPENAGLYEREWCEIASTKKVTNRNGTTGWCRMHAYTSRGCMVALQELEWEDVQLYRSGGTQIIADPIAPAGAAAEPADQSAIDENVVKPDEETFAAMRWASKLEDDANVLCLLRSLPKPGVEAQVQL